MQITITLSESQVKALHKLDLKDDAQRISQNAISSAIKGKFKYYAEKAEEQTAKHFDFVARQGVKLDTDKGAFVSKYMKEIRDIVNDL